jgi:hypothetical protein
MPYHIKKSSILSDSVPTDGILYYTENGNWSNKYSDRAIFDSEENAKLQVEIRRLHGSVEYPKGSQFISE